MTEMEQESIVNNVIWDALSQSSGCDEGWQFLDWKSLGECQVAVGIRNPGRFKGVLFGFREKPPVHLPQGRGFFIDKFSTEANGATLHWVGVSESSASSEEMFFILVEDLLKLLEEEGASPEKLLARIKEWQYFMERKKTPSLSADEEIGLWGELYVLKKSLSVIKDSEAVLAAWVGPEHGVHDFSYEAGVDLEVKSTARQNGFRIKVDSLDQLDEASCSCPLYLSAIQLISDPNLGQSVEDLIADIRNNFGESEDSIEKFNHLLCLSGWMDNVTKAKNKFSVRRMVFYRITPDFPCLMKSLLPASIVSAQYELDLNNVEVEDISMSLEEVFDLEVRNDRN